MTVFRSEVAPGGVHRFDATGPTGDLKPGPLNVADDLFLIMLDDAKGQLRVHPRVAGYALAGALLAELCQERHITLDRLRVQVVLDQPLPADAALRRTLGLLLVEPEQVGVASWVEYLATTALDRVSRQLESAGWNLRTPHRRMGGTRVRYEPKDRNAVFWRASRLPTVLVAEPAWRDLVLFGLVEAAGFAATLLGGCASPPAPERLTSESRPGWESVASPAPDPECAGLPVVPGGQHPGRGAPLPPVRLPGDRKPVRPERLHRLDVADVEATRPETQHPTPPEPRAGRSPAGAGVGHAWKPRPHPAPPQVRGVLSRPAPPEPPEAETRVGRPESKGH